MCVCVWTGVVCCHSFGGTRVRKMNPKCSKSQRCNGRERAARNKRGNEPKTKIKPNSRRGWWWRWAYSTRNEIYDSHIWCLFVWLTARSSHTAYGVLPRELKQLWIIFILIHVFCTRFRGPFRAALHFGLVPSHQICTWNGKAVPDCGGIQPYTSTDAVAINASVDPCTRGTCFDFGIWVRFSGSPFFDTQMLSMCVLRIATAHKYSHARNDSFLTFWLFCLDFGRTHFSM